MPDQPQQSDPWATVRERSEFIGIRRVVAWEDVDAARAEVKRRHAEALKAKDAERDALLYRVGELGTERDTLRTQLTDAIAMRDAIAAAKTPVSASDMSHLEMANAVLRAQLDQQAQRYNAALDRLIADKDQLSLAGSRLRAQRAAVSRKIAALLARVRVNTEAAPWVIEAVQGLIDDPPAPTCTCTAVPRSHRAQRAAVQSATPEAVTRELERGHYSIIRAWLALHGGTSAQIAVEEMAQLVRSFGEPLTLQEPKA